MTPVSDTDNEIDALYASLNSPRPLLIVLSGPSGVGKDATLSMLKQCNYPFYFVVTATTRPIRPGEVDGRDYHFLSVGEFAGMIEQGELLEYAVVYGDYKGIPKKHVRQALASGLDVIMRIDVQGAATIRRLVPNVVTIFLTAESEEELVRRLQERKTEDAGKEFVKGMQLIYQRLFESLKKLGLEPLAAAGMAFDPHVHHAVEMVETEETADNTVIDEYQRGYNFKGRLLRPAMVRVAVEPASRKA